MPGCADYTVSILHVVDLLGRNGMRVVFFTIQGLGVFLKTDDNFLFFILTFLFPFLAHWVNHLETFQRQVHMGFF